MITLKKTDSNDRYFQQLVVELDQYLAIIDGEEHAFYAQYNKTDAIKHVLVAYLDERPVACGAIKHYAEGTMEVKRMYAAPDVRGKGVASLVLGELENWANSLGYQHCVLETGKKQADAVRLYEKNGYRVIPNYGQYVGANSSVCFEKEIVVSHA